MRLLDITALTARVLFAAIVPHPAASGEFDITVTARSAPDSAEAARMIEAERVQPLWYDDEQARCCHRGDFVFSLCPNYLSRHRLARCPILPDRGYALACSSSPEADAPVISLAIVGLPGRRIHPLTLDVALPDRGPAELELVDVAGNCAFARDLYGAAPAVHRVWLDEAALVSGVYRARLEQQGRQVVTKVVIVQ
jgi:hypothetical protein